jgi:hypothetical protein
VETLIISLFAISCLYGVLRPHWAFAMIVTLFPIEQLLQAGAPALKSGALGNQAVNYLVGLVGLGSSWVTFVGRDRSFAGLANGVSITVLLALLWATTSLLWSLDRAGGLDMTLSTWPYFFLRIVIGTYLIANSDDLNKAVKSVLILGSVVAVLILINPAFSVQWGRLGVVEGGKMSSNPLALGELGGTLFLFAAVYRQQHSSPWMSVLRLVAAVIGLLIAVQSGARGQLFLSVFTAAIFFPFAAPIRNVSSAGLSVIGIAAILGLALLISNIVLEGVAAKRFSSEELLHGQSSFSQRWGNVQLLADAWLSRPEAMILGLGYFSFNALSSGEAYSHVVAADFVFELGLPGAVLLIAFACTTLGNCIALVHIAKESTLIRPAIMVLVAYVCFLVLLANKQGDLWGSTGLFMASSLVARLAFRLRIEGAAES